MDAQNATEAASMKPTASSVSNSLPSRNISESERSKASSSTLVKTSAGTRLPTAYSKDAKPSSAKVPPLPASATPSQLQSFKEPPKDTPKSPATITAVSSTFRGDTASTASREKQDDDGGGTDGNSEAETIVLGKDGSPAKPRNRKVIKHEDKRNGDCGSSISAHDGQVVSTRKHISERKENPSLRAEKSHPSMTISDDKSSYTEGGRASTPFLQQKKKRLQEKQLQSSHHQLHAGSKRASSSLSSAPASPPHSRQLSSNPQSGSDSDRQTAKSPMPLLSTSKDKLRPTEKLIPNKRKAPKAESEDEAENRKARRQRLNGAGEGDINAHTGKAAKSQLHHSSHNGSSNNAKPSTSRPQREPSRNRSISPQPRGHRRSLSTQLPSQSNGLSQKKKRPAPLHSTDYHSDESSASGSLHIRSSKPRSLTTPATADSTMSPAKIGPHKKHLDAHGQTFLARACARGEYDLAKQRLAERPEDLNTADFAGNTPLQIAALNGYANIVKLLIDAGCNVDCVNHDKDTPLLDAVDNGHLEVVKLLLDAGVSPRKANVHGEEPLDRVNDDIENAAEIRAALVSARKREGERRHTSEENRHEHDEPRFSHGPDSPRRSPAPSSFQSTAISRRAGTTRATKTSNHLLYMPMDDKTLRLAAGRGDEETVTRILQVREAFDDPESMVAAARGGHDIVMQLLLALGRANPDPEPIASMPAEHATPMLAAIGQENLKVVNLLLEQNSFDPTRRFHGNTYYEIARQRAGPNWKEEEDLLKIAYDDYKKGHFGKDGKARSPVRKDSESRRAGRVDPGEESSSRVHKHKLSSPLQERGKRIGVSKASTSGVSTSPREDRPLPKRLEHSTPQADGKVSPKRSGAGPLSTGKHRRDDRSSVVSGPDRDTPPPIVKQLVKSKKTDPEVVAISSEGETVKPRRKLISGRELKDEKEKQRRASLASTNTAPSKEATSPRESRSEDSAADKARAEKHRDRDRDRARQLKNEESRESMSGTDGGSSKRHRMSETPPNLTSSDKDAGEAPIKRRRLDGDNSTSGGGKERKAPKASGSTDDVLNKPTSSGLSRDAPKGVPKRRDEDDRKGVPTLLKTKKRDASSDRGRKGSAKLLSAEKSSEKSIHVKSEDMDIEMTDVSTDVRASISSDATRADSETRAQRMREDERKAAQAEIQAAEASRKKEEEARRLRQEEEGRRRREEEDRRKREDERRKREEEAKRKEEEGRKKREDEERKEKERRRLEEEERKRKEEERKRREEEERRKHAEEEERKKRAEEERLRREQLAKEAAEEARRKQEEDERRERERQEQEREERERIRARREAEERRRRQLEEEKQARISKLPALLQWLSKSTDASSSTIARKFRMMQGVRYDCINPNATGSAIGREQWLLNTQAALILGDNDLSLSRYPSWQHAPVSMIAKRIIWRLETDRYALTEPDLYDLGKQLPDYYGGADPDAMSYQVVERLRGEAWEKFSATDMFFVKVCPCQRPPSSGWLMMRHYADK